MTKTTIASDGTALQARALLEEGLTANREGNATRAAELFSEALALAPSWHVPAFMLGSEYAAAGDFVRAEAYFAQTVLLAPDFHIARYQLGLLQFSGGRPQLAMLTWAPLQSLPADQPFPHLVQAFAALMVDEFEAARALFEAALPLSASNAGLAQDVGKLLDSIQEQIAVDKGGRDRTEAEKDKEATVSHVLLSNYAGHSIH